MGKFTTQNRIEAKKNPELIYISRTVVNSLRPLRILRCKNCKCIINDGVNKKFSRHGACSEWCLDFIKPDRVTKLDHRCNLCNNPTSPIRTTKEYSNGNGYTKNIGTIISWRKICDDCRDLKKNKNNKEVKIPQPKLRAEQKDTVGHSCVKCKEYKLWDEFYTVNDRKKLICKVCSRIETHNSYVNNLEKNRERSKKNYFLRKEKALINKDKNGK